MTNISPVRQIRKALGLNQKTLAEKIGVSQSSVCGYERDRQEISPAIAVTLVEVAVAAGLDIGLDHVYGRKPVPQGSA